MSVPFLYKVHNIYTLVQINSEPELLITLIFCTCIQGESVNVEESLSSLTVTAPSIVAFGETRGSPTEIRVLVEGTVVIVPSVMAGLHYCFTSYYVFNISFPNEFRLPMLFLEKFIYGLKPLAKSPLSVINFYDNVSRH